MKKGLLVLSLLAALSCGRSLQKQVVEQVRTFDNASLGEKQVEVKNVIRQGDQAVAEVEITTAVKLTRKEGRWLIQEFRIGDRRWETAENILAVINARRNDATHQQLNLLKDGIRRYAESEGEVPQVSTFEELTDLLSPRFIDPVFRIDAWSNPFSYEAQGLRTYDLRSAGTDGIMRTADDIVMTPSNR